MSPHADSPDLRVFPPGPQRKTRRLFTIIAVVIIALIVLPQLTGILTDLLWFQEIGFTQVYTKSLTWRVALFFIGASAAFGLFHYNVRFALSDTSRTPLIITNPQTGARVELSSFIRRIGFIAACFFALITGITVASRWMVAVQEIYGVQAGRVDPLFGRDIGFYLFKLPAIEGLLSGLMTLLALTIIASSVAHLASGALVFQQRVGLSIQPRAARHIAALIAVWFVLAAIELWFVNTSQLLFSTTGPLVGASYTDVHATLPAIRVSAIAAVAAALFILVGAFRGTFARSLAIAVVLYVVQAIVGRGMIPAAMQKLSVVPNELQREGEYIKRHLDATRVAWALDSVTTRDLNGDTQLSLADIQSNAPTIENVRLWERELVGQTFKQLQEIRTYYDFVSVTDDRYIIDGRYRQVHLSAREVNASSLPTRTFINEHLTFTHGMGITMAPVNQVTSEGLPLLFIKDLPPVSTVSIKLTRPQIYYGELTNSYVFVGTNQKEFDYPAGDANVETAYSGRGGVPIGSFWRRALYAWQFGALKILLSNDVAENAKVLYRRKIETRAQTALPFLSFDREPYLMVNDAGELKWILDAYTSSERYPYAQRTADGLSYMRNSVKVVIDAYDGNIDAYITDPNEPIIRTLSAAFPGILKPMTDMPADVRRHIRFPGDLFSVQASLQTTYHMTEPDAFYHREDQWQIPQTSDENSANPYLRHIILRLPGEKSPEFIYMTPFTPRGKDNLAAWMVARMDGDHYGEMIVYRFPKQSLVYGPKQVSNRINQDTEISRQLALWDQRGSEVIRGELLVIPIEESLIYVQPIFTRAEGGNIPELKRVVVTHGNRVVMSETLESGLSELFGGTVPNHSAVANAPTQTAGATPAANAASADRAELLRQAQAHYDKAISAQRAGDWTTYGKEIEALGGVLRQLQR